jgi:threonine dehydrogenase-like Zn-dependent dehydrogenase
MRAAVFVRQEHGLSPGLSDPEGGAGSRPDPLGLLRPVRHDASLFSGPSPFILRGITRYPFIPGHKWSGTIVVIGQEVGGLSGALGEYFSVPATAVIKLPATVGLDAAPLIEPATTVLRALHRTGCSIGDCVVGTGTGTLGLIAIQLPHAAGTRAGVVGIDAESGLLVQSLGAGHARRPGEPESSAYHVVLEFSGVPSSFGAAMSGGANRRRRHSAGAVPADRSRPGPRQGPACGNLPRRGRIFREGGAADSRGVIDPYPVIGSRITLARIEDVYVRLLSARRDAPRSSSTCKVG